MFLHVTSARYISNYRLWLEFNDGAKGEVDLAGELSGEIFRSLSDLEAFKNFTLNGELDTIVWSNGADFAPEFLHSLLQEAA
jgi:hypothetical protein